MTKHAILIGINKIPPMRSLASPSSYAIQMKDWAQGQGYTTYLFVDQPGTEQTAGECTRKDILRTVQNILANGTEQLLIYFAGHGFELSPGDDIWLLPDCLNDGSDAISIFACKNLAYRSGIPHVVFISDACRSLMSDSKVMHLTPGAIFPILDRDYRTEIDIFYSTHPGAKSIDVKDDDGNYISIYSDNLLKCLTGKVTEVIREVRRLQPNFPAVLSFELNDYLKTKVAEEIHDLTRKKQFPTANVSSSDPLFLSKFNQEGLAETIGETGLSKIVEQQPKQVDTRSVSEKLSLYINDKGDSAKRDMQRALWKAKQNYEFFTSDAVFNNRKTGLFISGIKDPAVFSSRHSDREYYRERRNFNIPQVLSLNHGERGESAIYFVANRGGKRFYPISVLSGFFTQVVFDRNEVLTVNYFPTDPNSKSDARLHVHEVAERKANITMAAKRGIFQGSHELNDDGGYYRKYKHLEPTLGLFAAYAYFQNGDFEGVKSLYDFLRRDHQAILGDISLLERLSNKTLDIYSDHWFPIPLLTQGWSYFNLLEGNHLSQLIKYLQPGLWTSFDRDGFNYFERELIRI